MNCSKRIMAFTWIFLLFFLFLFFQRVGISNVYSQNDSPTKAASIFFHSLGYMDYKKSWDYLSETSKRQLLTQLRKYFWQKGQDFSVDELKFLVQGNQDCHRNLLFNEFFSRMTMKMGVKASSFKTAKVAYVKGDANMATIRLTVEKKHSFYKVVRENGKWKVVFY